MWFLRQAKVPFHQVQAPSTKVKFLGWGVETEKMTVAAPPERMEQIRSISRLRGAKYRYGCRDIGVFGVDSHFYEGVSRLDAETCSGVGKRGGEV